MSLVEIGRIPWRHGGEHCRQWGSQELVTLKGEKVGGDLCAAWKGRSLSCCDPGCEQLQVKEVAHGSSVTFMIFVRKAAVLGGGG